MMDFTGLIAETKRVSAKLTDYSGATIVEVTKLITQLREYQKEVDRAIEVLQKLADQRAGRNGTRRHVSADTRKKMAAAQKKRWEDARDVHKNL